MQDASPSDRSVREGHVQIDHARLYYRETGQGQPLVILHGGPDFDHHYLLPAMDHLADSFRLIYYDQRGRGRSGGQVEPDEVSMASEVADWLRIIEHFQLDRAALLGHSWGALLALEFALRHPHRVSHLIVMNPAPASHDDLGMFRIARQRTAAADLEALRALSTTAGYEAGDLALDADYYRIHFRSTIQPEHMDGVIKNLRLGMTPAGIRKARAIEQRLYDETIYGAGYSLLDKLTQLTIPTLVIHGDQDFIPVACARHIAQAIPGARFAGLRCGHFAYLERPEEVHDLIVDLCHGRA